MPKQLKALASLLSAPPHCLQAAFLATTHCTTNGESDKTELNTPKFCGTSPVLGTCYAGVIVERCGTSLEIFRRDIGKHRTQWLAHLHLRALVDKPGSPLTDTLDHTVCATRVAMPFSAVPHACHRQDTGLCPLARTCSRTCRCQSPPCPGAPRL